MADVVNHNVTRTFEDLSAQEMRDMATALRARGFIALMDWNDEGLCNYKPMMEILARALEVCANHHVQTVDAAVSFQYAANNVEEQGSTNVEELLPKA